MQYVNSTKYYLDYGLILWVFASVIETDTEKIVKEKFLYIQ